MGHTVNLDKSSPSISYLCKKDRRLGLVIDAIGPMIYETKDDNPYDFLIHEIIEQMLSITAGQKIYERLNALCANAITPQRISQLSIEEIKGCGTSRSKAEYIHILTEAVLSGNIRLSLLEDMSDADVIKTLTSLRGLGTWSAKMYLIFVLDRQDVLPFEDGAFLQSYRWLYSTSNCERQTIISKCKKWKPYSSIAARYLYRALDCGLTKYDLKLAIAKRGMLLSK